MTTAYLSVIVPTPIVGSLLTSSTAPETDYAAWASGTTYAVDAFCISTATHRVYRSLAASNVGHDPTDINNRTGVTPWWQDFGPTNKWAMFDDEVSTQTELASPLTVVLHPGGFNALYADGLDAEQIDVTVKDAPGGNVIYSYSGDLEASAPGDYDEYFFSGFLPLTKFMATNIDQYNNAEATVTLTKSSGTVKCGILVVGDYLVLGKTQRNAKAKPKTYSYIKTDEFGKTKIMRRKATTDLVASAVLDLSEANAVLAIVRALLDVPVVCICSDAVEYNGLSAFGLVSGELSYPEPQDCLLSINVQGLI